MNSKLAKLKHELLEMLPPTIFFFVTLHIVGIVRALMTRSQGLSLPMTESVLIASLILGKAVILANLLPFVNRYPDKPLIWNVAWKTVLYSIVAFALHYLERLFDLWKETHSLGAAHHQLIAQMNWAHFAAVQILLLTLVFNYCCFAELARVMGRRKVVEMFIGRRRETPVDA